MKTRVYIPPKSPETFPLKEARTLIKDLTKPNPWIYWSDFLFHCSVGWFCFYQAVVLPLWSAPQILAYAVASFFLYRSALFIHELSHLRRNSFKVFRLVWNLLAGFPLFVPSYSYTGVHLDHHKRNVYGTKTDGEYLPFGAESPVMIPLHFFGSCLLPFIVAFRAMVLTPLSLVFPFVRRWTWSHLSSLAIDLSYAREPLQKRDRLWYRFQEGMACIYGYTMLYLYTVGVIPGKAIVLWYILSCSMYLINALRTFAAHSYRNPGDESLSLPEQFLDSVDIPGNRIFTELWAPVGLRYHATHHLFPNVPYHNLGKVRRRLESQLSDVTLYNEVLRPSLFSALWRLWKDAREASAEKDSVHGLATPK